MEEKGMNVEDVYKRQAYSQFTREHPHFGIYIAGTLPVRMVACLIFFRLERKLTAYHNITVGMVQPGDFIRGSKIPGI